MRLQRLFMAKTTTKAMRWHHDRIVVEGELSHPADGDEWKQFDRRFHRFSKEIRNVRLGLSTDGFDPFRDKHTKEYTVWPVVVVVYNLPPSMCTKAPYMFMPLLIPGPTDPTKDLHAALLWTISDFPGLAMLRGWSTKGKLSCPVCMGEVKGKQLKHCGKISFYGTARYFLESDNPLRRSTKFGSVETRLVCSRHSGGKAKVMCEQIQFPPPGKSHKKKPRDYGVTHNWTHFSPFFELPYWETLSLRHNIDIMHTEKNVFDNIFYTILGDGKKTKDNTKSRKDCQELRVHRELWIRGDGTEPHAPYTLSKEQVHKLFKWIESLKLPDGYVSNISRCVNWVKNCIRGMKSHDGHVFMQKLLPIVCRDLLPKHVADPIIELCNFFQDLCSSNLKYSDLEKMEKDIVRIMSKLETIFTPGFFDPMEHLPLHLATEYKLGGPANGHWMYFIERYLLNLKLKVGNKARAEGSMAQRYIEEECVKDDEKLKEKFIDLIRGPLNKVESYKACKCNGYKFDCVNANELTSPNSGVIVIGTSYKESYGNYYGRIEEIFKLLYHNGHKVMVFKCDWFDHTKHVKVDKHRMTTVDVKSKLNAEDVFVLASQAHQVYYAPNILNAKSSWYTVLTTKRRLVNESVSTQERNKIDDDALQNEVSNASSSHVKRVIVRDPSYFFIDLRMFENDYSMDDNGEEENKKMKKTKTKTPMRTKMMN
ncbi:uncharacterized protein LOC141679298 [Apium graveolens]|uniref:uncharacterized protein LOC141679298 n=1 Tax=Apium graveolens TaxID=4045 RepID=UPI003D79283A